ncbi:hypothetical protein GCM10010435_34240 [Winogradskya consettensis]|uniref:Uncharacterized protein n=1 Tax=Winogradskya consettensis TaxID=113560 RepID=A0A919SDK1_9ACTN|nr:hypothetical protein [Actinoplanes consettensis]GIM69861.1 hypothetical protein Aco04nite_17250 [Actinoplanes consettensis]
MVMTDAYEDTREACRTVARTYLDMDRFVTGQVGQQGRARAGIAAQDALDLLHQLGCLAQTLENRVDELVALDRRLEQQGGAAPGPLRAELLRLASAPCRVVFTAATGVPPRSQTMPVARIVAEAAEREREIRLAVRAVRLGETLDGPVVALREQLAKLETLIADALRAGLGHGRPPVSPEALAVLDRLARWEKAADSGRWREFLTGDQDGDGLPAEVVRATERAAVQRRALRQGYYSELTGLLAAYRQKAVNDGLGELLTLDPFYQAARRSLNPDGFDLAVAAAAVLAYQRAVNGDLP